MVISVLFQGFALGASMIIPLGVQNSYILSQGIKRNHHFLTATICMLCDVLLIGLGIFGGGKLIASNQWLMSLMGWGGLLFLLTYAGFAFRNVWRNQYKAPAKVQILTSRKAVVGTTLAVTLLNPHVYLDTVMILGSVAGTFKDHEKIYFALGTMIASLIWFYSLAGAAAKLAPLLSKAKAQRIIDLIIGLIMLFVAFMLFTSILN
jgi:L-lysine exporter family protein LysE/ArgO